MINEIRAILLVARLVIRVRLRWISIILLVARLVIRVRRSASSYNPLNSWTLARLVTREIRVTRSVLVARLVIREILLIRGQWLGS